MYHSLLYLLLILLGVSIYTYCYHRQICDAASQGIPLVEAAQGNLKRSVERLSLVKATQADLLRSFERLSLVKATQADLQRSLERMPLVKAGQGNLCRSHASVRAHYPDFNRHIRGIQITH